MPQLYDKTGKPLNVQSTTDAEGMLRSGHAFALKSDVFKMRDKDGNAVDSTGSELADNLNNGLSISTPIQEQADRYAKSNAGFSGAIKQAGSSFFNQALMGVPEVVGDLKDSSLEKEKALALAREHPVAQGVGGTLGFGTSLLYGGELTGAVKVGSLIGKGADVVAAKLLGDAAERGLAKRMLAAATKSAVQMGAESAAWEMPKAAAQVALGDPDTAAENIVATMGAGALIGSVASPLLGGLGKIFKGKPGEDIIDKKEAAIKMLGIKPGDADRLRNITQQDLTQTASELRLYRHFNKKDAYDELLTLKGYVGKKIGDIYKQADEALAAKGVNEPIDLTGILDNVKRDYLDPYKLPNGEYRMDYAKQATQIENKIDEMSQIPITTLSQLKNERDLLGKVFNKKGGLQIAKSESESLLDDAYADIYHGINDKIRNEIVPTIAESVGNPQLAKDLTKFSRQYSVLSDLQKPMLKASQQERGKPIISMKDLGAAIFGGELGKIPGALAAYGINKAIGFVPHAQFFLADIVNGTARNLNKIPDAVGGLINPGHALSNLQPAGISALIHKPSPDKDDIIRQIDDDVMMAANDPEKLSTIVASRIEPLAGHVDDATRTAMAAKSMQIAQHIASIAPRKPEQSILDTTKARPSDTEMSQFNRRVEIALNPYSILKDIKNGLVTRDQIETVKQLYPNVYSKIVAEISSEVTKMNKAGKRIPYAAKIKLSYLLGQNLDRSMNNVKLLQATYQTQPSQPKNQLKTSKLKTPTMMSESDRLLNRNQPT